MKLLGSTQKDVDKDKNGEYVPKLESVEVVLVHCNLVGKPKEKEKINKAEEIYVPPEKRQQIIDDFKLF